MNSEKLLVDIEFVKALAKEITTQLVSHYTTKGPIGPIFGVDLMPGWFDAQGAVRYSGICLTNIREALRKGNLETRFQGGKRLIRRESLDAWIESGKGKRASSGAAVRTRLGRQA